MHLSAEAHKSISGDSLTTFLGPLGFLLVVPLSASNDNRDNKTIYRMSCPPEKGVTTVNLEYLQKVMDTGLGLRKDQTPTVEKVLWSSHFRVRSAVAESFYRRIGGGFVLLVGDAAHVHSPAGALSLDLLFSLDKQLYKADRE